MRPEVLRRLFNDSRCYERACANELLESINSDKPPRAEANQPPGTRSITAWYYELGPLRKLVFVHYYLLPDGSIGGHGLPDPKRMILDDVILIADDRL